MKNVTNFKYSFFYLHNSDVKKFNEGTGKGNGGLRLSVPLILLQVSPVQTER